MQDRLKIEILKEGYENLKQELMDDLKRKSQFVADKLNGKLDDASFKRVKAEQAHIERCLAFFSSVKNLIEGFEDELQLVRSKNSLVEFFKNESNEYMGKYYDLMIKSTNGKGSRATNTGQS